MGPFKAGIAMEIKVKSKDKDSIELEILGEREAVLNHLRQKLLEDKNVAYATYTMGHPELEHPSLFIKVKDGKPKAALKRAVDSIINELEEIDAAFEKASA